MKELILRIEPLPTTSLGKKIKNIVGDEWDEIRIKCFRATRCKCAICGAEGNYKNVFFNKRRCYGLECHEKWRYDEETQTQIFERFVALCVKCHNVVHFNQEENEFIKGKEWYIPRRDNQEEVLKHFKKVNDCDIEIVGKPCF
ncbi:MAG TPA: hypothetical protein VF360_02910 [Candidatus Methanoperedens sp.]